MFDLFTELHILLFTPHDADAVGCVDGLICLVGKWYLLYEARGGCYINFACCALRLSQLITDWCLIAKKCVSVFVSVCLEQAGSSSGEEQ